MKGRVVLVLIFAVQVICAFFFVSDILSSVLGLRSTPISWEMRELMEIGASIGLILGLLFGALALRKSFRERRVAEEKLRRASTAFLDLMQERFSEWGLTPAEKDVALFAIKGMTTAEIAGLRNTSEGTVKAQTNAIYRKAGVSGRPQLLSLFIEDLMQDALPGVKPEENEAAA
ncbi:helix-turn-helix transcriptional regulator [Thioclava sp. FR2]|uniref:helix-turn-helix transcriptional regulator n=1 Tax=Thioclava sp. FR2 TaxID=3445780 RepID=UPI003EBA96C1